MEGLPEPQFPATRWSLLVEARGADFGQALAELCRLYWGPLYVFARRYGLSPQDAEDLTQDFFHGLISERDRLLSGINPADWKLRSFFLTVFKRRIIDWQRRALRVKRGGGPHNLLPLAEAEALLPPEAGTRSPEQEFDRQWALSVLDHSLRRLELDCVAVEKAGYFEALRPFLGLCSQEPDYRRVEEQLGCSTAAARQAVVRFRQRFRQTLREEIAATLPVISPEAVDEELRQLQNSLRD